MRALAGLGARFLGTALAFGLAGLVAACDSPAERCAKAWSKEAFLQPADHFEHCLEGCDRGRSAAACQIAAWCLRDGNCRGGPRTPDYERALGYARLSAELGEALPASARERPEALFAERRDLWRFECLVEPGPCLARCERDDAEACGWLAGMHQRGFGRVKKDAGRALGFYRRACDLDYGCTGDGFRAACGSPDACIRRCEQGEAEACYWIAALLREGDSSRKVLRDPERARRELERACRLDAAISRRCAGLGQAEAPEPAGP
jgi:TPR repeat protein